MSRHALSHFHRPLETARPSPDAQEEEKDRHPNKRTEAAGREDVHGSFPPCNRREKETSVDASRRPAPLFRETARSALGSTPLQIVARHQPVPALLRRDLGLPPAVVLEPQHSKDIPLGEAELL